MLLSAHCCWLIAFFLLLFSIKQGNVHIMLTVAAVWVGLLISGLPERSEVR